MDKLILPSLDPVAISSDERDFFIALGGRIARIRKEQDITQAELAEMLGISQQTMNSYETGRRRIPVSLLPDVAKRLGVAVEALLADDGKAGNKRGPTPKLQQQMDRITQLPRTKQQFVMQVIDSVLAQATR
ncbi:helix-turn-helix domain-containing protein [Solilutibacter silvestris]|uniref:Helix-turn-helix protein n=1 Tax=Solilutibacter silvestris TaxID=1645665 RepID=A0A2K1Q485_9GAMM|nr:helix-turn-helix domain-containing protein [Lysobacter silvestris]PNS09856.1 helix-turn-helix protein [Lysobacter silvestris]